jgi:hypothetical protein
MVAPPVPIDILSFSNAQNIVHHACLAMGFIDISKVRESCIEVDTSSSKMQRDCILDEVGVFVVSGYRLRSSKPWTADTHRMPIPDSTFIA